MKAAMALLMISVIAILSAGCQSEADKQNAAGATLGNRGYPDRLKDAIEDFDLAIRRDSQFTLAYYNRAQAYFGLEQYEEAIKDYDQAIGLDPESVLLFTKRGEVYFALGQYERALQDHEQAIRLDSQFAPAYYNRGGAYFKLGQRDQSIQDYQRAVSLYRRLVSPGYRGCDFYDDLKQYQPAIKDCRSLSRLDPGFAKAFGERAFARFEQGQYKQAIRDYDVAIRLDSNRELYNSRGLAYKGLGKFDEAFQDFETAIGRRAGFAPGYYNRGILLYELEEYQYAAETFSRAIASDPLYADAYAQRALAYTLLVKDKLAKRDIDQAVELGVDRVELEADIQELKEKR